MAKKAVEYLDPNVIQQVARLDLKAKFIVEGFIAGLHKSPFHGFSVEFSEHRKYSLGDEIKSIDWGVYAKTDKYYVRKYEAETNLECYLFVDMSESMGYRYDKSSVTKLEYATYLAAAMGYLMTKQQDPVGLVTFDTAIRTYMECRSKRGHLITILSELSKNKPGGRTDFSKALSQATGLIRHRGLIVLFTDLLDDEESVLEGIHNLRFRGHEVIIFHVLDAGEVDFPFKGMTIFEDVETEERIQIDPEGIRDSFRTQVQQMIERYESACRDANVDYVQVTTSTPFDTALVEFLMRRQRKC